MADATVSNTVECKLVWVRVPPSAPQACESPVDAALPDAYYLPMTNELACVLCMVPPQATVLVVPMAQATIIALPFFFRSRITAGVRRALRRSVGPVVPAPSDEDCDTRADDRAGPSEPPGALRP
jgi:hypothetical protein